MATVIRGDDNFDSADNGRVIGVTTLVNTTRQALPIVAEHWISYGTVVKKSATSKLICTECTSGQQNYSGTSGVGVKLGTTIIYGNSNYTGQPHSHQYQQTFDFGTMGGAGSFGVSWGWKCMSGGAKPFVVLNPNVSDDNRYSQTRSTIVILEVEA